MEFTHTLEKWNISKRPYTPKLMEHLQNKKRLNKQELSKQRLFSTAINLPIIPYIYTPTQNFEIATDFSNGLLKWSFYINCFEICIERTPFLVSNVFRKLTEKEHDFMDKLEDEITESNFLYNFYKSLYQHPKTRIRLISSIGAMHHLYKK